MGILHKSSHKVIVNLYFDRLLLLTGLNLRQGNIDGIFNVALILFLASKQGLSLEQIVYTSLSLDWNRPCCL